MEGDGSWKRIGAETEPDQSRASEDVRVRERILDQLFVRLEIILAFRRAAERRLELADLLCVCLRKK